MTRRWLPVAIALLGAMVAGGCARAAGSPPPNFIVIVADDLGYADLGVQGGATIATPRLDRMAREGIRFTDAYSAAPFCSPSRAALLTGRLPARCGVPYVLFPAEHHGLPAAELTLAELLRARGYATACIGKWHLGWAPPFRPQRHGFDVFFGTPYSNDSTEWAAGEPFLQVMGLAPFPLVDGDRIVAAPVDQATLTQRYTERAVAFIRENRERPFFLYLPHTMPHVPQYASPAFAGKSRGGLYGDTVEELDWSTGVILDTLRELGLDARTLVVFTSDNGAPFRAVAREDGAAKAKKKQAGVGRFPGRALAGSNGPLRAGKGTTFEGGIRVPLIVRWPGGGEAGRVISEPVSLLDLLPTCVTLAGAVLPADRVFDGRDLCGLLTGKADAGAPRLLYHYFGYQAQAVREGRWKLFPVVDRRPEPRPASLWYDHQPALFDAHHRLRSAPELYDLAQDPGEQRNVAADHPEIVARLAARVREFDRVLQHDRRPMEFAAGPPPPAPGAIRPADGPPAAIRN